MSPRYRPAVDKYCVAYFQMLIDLSLRTNLHKLRSHRLPPENAAANQEPLSRPIPPPPRARRAQSEQPVRGPVSCGMSDRITQNSLCIPKAVLCWECVVSSEACLLGSLIFHLVFSLSLPLHPFFFSPSVPLPLSPSLSVASQPASLSLTLAYIPYAHAFVSRCVCSSVACCPFAFPYSTFLLFRLTPHGTPLLVFVRMFCRSEYASISLK